MHKLIDLKRKRLSMRLHLICFFVDFFVHVTSDIVSQNDSSRFYLFNTSNLNNEWVFEKWSWFKVFEVKRWFEVMKVINFVLLTVKNLRRMKSWTVSETSSETAVRSNWALSIVNVRREVSSTLCCLLSRIYDAWKAELCQKHLQRLLFDLTKLWVLWMWNEK